MSLLSPESEARSRGRPVKEVPAPEPWLNLKTALVEKQSIYSNSVDSVEPAGDDLVALSHDNCVEFFSLFGTSSSGASRLDSLIKDSTAMTASHSSYVSLYYAGNSGGVCLVGGDNGSGFQKLRDYECADSVHGEFVTSLHAGGTGVALFSASNMGTVRAWDFREAKPVFHFPASVEKGKTFCRVCPDDTRIVTTGVDKILRIWDLRQGSVLSEFESHSVPTALSVVPDRNDVIVGFEEGSILVLNTTDLSEVIALSAHSEPVRHLSTAPSGDWMLSVCSNEVVCWELETGPAFAKINFPAPVCGTAIGVSERICAIVDASGCLAQYSVLPSDVHS